MSTIFKVAKKVLCQTSKFYLIYGVYFSQDSDFYYLAAVLTNSSFHEQAAASVVNNTVLCLPKKQWIQSHR